MDGWTALSMVESGNNDYAVGRAGEISRYQVLKKEWHSVTNSRAYSHPQTAATVARILLTRRIEQFEQKLHRPPSSFEAYVLWNAPAQALNGRATRTVAARARRFANLCDPQWLASGSLHAALARHHLGQPG